MFTRRDLIAGAVALAGAGAAQAQELPLARIIMGNSPGSAGDNMARFIAERMRGGYAASVIVENRSGAGGQIAMGAVKDGPADGSLILLTPSSLLSIFPYTYKNLPYDPFKDFTAVSLACYANMALGVGPGVPDSVRTLQDYVAFVKANPGKASYGSPASGSIPHLIMVFLAHATGAALTHVGYRGSTPAIPDLKSGALPALIAPHSAFLPHLSSGIRLLAVSGDKRSPRAPDVGTFREQGVAITAREWYGFFLNSRTPAPVVQRLAAALRATLTQGDVTQTIGNLGFDAAVSTPEELDTLLRADNAEWRDLIKLVGFTSDS